MLCGYKKLLIDAIVGVGFSGVNEEKMVAKKLAVFTGNQHNPSWRWERVGLSKFKEHELEHLYMHIRKSRDEFEKSYGMKNIGLQCKTTTGER